jgi:hypothetical protein
MAHDGTGTGWDITAPSNDDPISDSAQEQRDLRRGVGIRSDKEHVALAASSVGGEHKAGSAKVYASTSAPTQRPDGSTVFTADDKGRLWVNETDDKDILSYYDGSSWSEVVTPPKEDSVDTAHLKDNAVTTDKVLAENITEPKLADDAVSTRTVLDDAITLSKLPDGVLTADAGGRAKMADAYVTLAKLATDAVGAKLKAIDYTGTGASGNEVTVGFQPDFVVILQNTSVRGWAIASRAQASGDLSNIIYSWADTSMGSSETDAIEWKATSVEFKKNTGRANISGVSYTLIAFKFSE